MRSFDKRIGFVGVQGVGKTTLVNEMSKWDLLRDHIIVSGITHEVKNMGIPINEHANDDAQKLILWGFVYNLYRYDKFIADRSMLCVLGFAYQGFLDKRISLSMYNEVHTMANKSINRYDYLFYIRPEFALESNGIRSDDVGYRDKCSDAFDQVISWYPQVRIVTGTVEERLEQIIHAIQK